MRVFLWASRGGILLSERPIAAPILVFAMISSWIEEETVSEVESGQMFVESRLSKVMSQFKLHQAVRGLGMCGSNTTNSSKDEALTIAALESKCFNMS